MEQLPWIVQKKILRMLSLSDLANLTKVSKHFQHLISMEYMSWIRDIPIVNVMPQSRTIAGLRWLAAEGNIEATIKLAILLPYQDGCVSTGKGRKECTTLAAELFYSLESTEKLKYPLTWMFIRPPWSTSTVCRKLMVYNHILTLIDNRANSANLCYCIAKVHMLFESGVENTEPAKCWLERSYRQGSIDAQFQLWKWKLGDTTGSNQRSLEGLYRLFEPGTRLNLIRELRSLASMKYEPAEIQLCKLYARGHRDGITTAKAYCTVRNFFTRSRPFCDKVFRSIQSDVTAPMRYILVDWLMEVATIKYFSTATLHATVQCLDRYLALRLVSRKYFQLVGIACMVICSRGMETEILTIREAVWFTDSSFKYKELVTIIGDIVSALRGDIKLTTVTDYLEILLMVPNMNEKTKSLSRFVADSSILYADVGLIPPSLVACSCVLLANLSVDPDSVAWNSEMEEMTGFSVPDLQSVTLKLHDKCISMRSSERHAKEGLNALDEKYEGCMQGPITRDQIVGYDRAVEFFEKYKAPTSNDDATTVQPLPGAWYPVHTETCCPASYQEACTALQLPDVEMDADTPPTLFCAYALQADTKSRKRIQSGEDRASVVLPLSSRNTEIAPAEKNRDTAKISLLGAIASHHGRHSPPTSSHKRGKARSKENSDRNATKDERITSDANEDELAQRSRDSFLPASKSIKLMR